MLPLSTRKSLSRVSASTKLSGFTFCLTTALVTIKHKYFPGICDATGGSAMIPPTPGLRFHNNLLFLHSLDLGHKCCFKFYIRSYRYNARAFRDYKITTCHNDVVRVLIL